MRVMCVEPGPYFSVQDVHAGYVEAFADLGCQTVSLNLNDRLGFYADAGRISAETGEFVHMVDHAGAVRLAAKGLEAACFEFWPDVLFVTSAFFVPLDTLDIIRARGITVVINHLESPYEDDRQWTRAQRADLNLINDPTNLHLFPKGTMYMPAAHRPSVHYPGPVDPDLAADFVFVGSGFPSRIEFLEQVDWSGVDVTLAGMWRGLDKSSPLLKFVGHDVEECLDNDETARLYRSGLTGANLYRKEVSEGGTADGWACGPREIELAACGLWFARQSRGESDDLFPMLPTFESPEELGEQVRWALAHPEQRQAGALAAAAAVQDRTFISNAARVLAAIERNTNVSSRRA